MKFLLNISYKHSLETFWKAFLTKFLINIINIKKTMHRTGDQNFYHHDNVHILWLKNKNSHFSISTISRIHGLLLSPIIYIVASHPISLRNFLQRENSVAPAVVPSSENEDRRVPSQSISLRKSIPPVAPTFLERKDRRETEMWVPSQPISFFGEWRKN